MFHGFLFYYLLTLYNITLFGFYQKIGRNGIQTGTFIINLCALPVNRILKKLKSA